MSLYLKYLKRNGRSPIQDYNYKLFLPRKKDSSNSNWTPEIANYYIMRRGYHFTNIKGIHKWISDRLYIVEADKVMNYNNKGMDDIFCSNKIRFIRQVKEWNNKAYVNMLSWVLDYQYRALKPDPYLKRVKDLYSKFLADELNTQEIAYAREDFCHDPDRHAWISREAVLSFMISIMWEKTFANRNGIREHELSQMIAIVTTNTGNIEFSEMARQKLISMLNLEEETK